GGGVLIALVAIATGGVGLPHLDQLTRHRPAPAVADSTGHDGARPEGRPVVAHRQVSVERVDVLVAEAGCAAFDLLGVDDHEWMFRVTQDAAAVGRAVEPRLPLFAPEFGCDAGHLRRDVTLGGDTL